MNRIVRTLVLAVGLLCGVLGSQAPEFAQQYRQRLGGGIDELKRIVVRFERDATKAGKSIVDAIGQLQSSPDQLVRSRGDAMQADIQRLKNMERQRDEMQTSGPFFRIAYMLKGMDATLASATYAAYEPAVPVTQEGFASAAVGFIFGGGLMLFLTRMLRAFFGGKKKKTTRPASAETTRSVSRRLAVLSDNEDNESEQPIQFRTINRRGS